MNPILFQQVPPLDTVSSKLVASIDACASSSDTQAEKKTLTTAVLPYLKSRFHDTKTRGKKPAVPATSQLLAGFSAAMKTLAAMLPLAQLFALVDMWRLTVVDDAIAPNCRVIPTNPNLDVLLLEVERLRAEGCWAQLHSHGPSPPLGRVCTRRARSRLAIARGLSEQAHTSDAGGGGDATARRRGGADCCYEPHV